MINVLDIATDHVINSKVLIARSNYKYALLSIYPLINKLDIQRNILKKSFYSRLEEDIIKGCIMPPLTLAIVKQNKSEILGLNAEELNNWVNKNIKDAFVLDGIQRLNTLKKASENLDFPTQYEQTLYFNIIICDSMNELLYRMITLNNGQQAMSVKHQIEILTNNLINVDILKINIQSDKERKQKLDKNAFSQSDITLAYLAFLTKSINIDNQKIIESKMDEILVNKVIENDVIYSDLEFADITNNLISKFTPDTFVFKWLNNTNNIIGFFVGILDTYALLQAENISDFETAIISFEGSFSYLKISKIKVGTLRRKLVSYFISNYERLRNKDSIELSEIFLDEGLI